MASNTVVTRNQRRGKRHSAGKERKRLIRSRGNTPAFPIEPPQD